MKRIFLKFILIYFFIIRTYFRFVLYKVLKNCGVMKFLADIPSCLGGEDNRTNVA